MKTSIVLGFSERNTEVCPGVWKIMPTEVPHRAKLLTYNKDYDTSDEVNDDMKLRNRYEIVMKDKKLDYQDMRYIIVKGKKWKVSALEFLDIRIIITLGGVYNG
jgi:hypothetical protein